MIYTKQMRIGGVFSLLIATLLALAIPLSSAHAVSMSPINAESTRNIDMKGESMSQFWRGHLFETELEASEETHDATPAVATGHAGAWFAGDGAYLNYWLSVFSKEPITGAHFHCAPDGVDGPVVVSLDNKRTNRDMTYATTSTSSSSVHGEIGRGYLEDSDIVATGRDCAQTIGYAINDVEDLARAVKDGDIYVNIHTSSYPAGAARGQLIPYPGWR